MIAPVAGSSRDAGDVFVALADPTRRKMIEQLSVLGPVGFWLANTLGPARALALAIVWPLSLGAVAAWSGLRRVRQMDLVT